MLICFNKWHIFYLLFLFQESKTASRIKNERRLESARLAEQNNAKRWADTERKEKEKKDQLLKKINELKNSIAKGWQQKRKIEGEKETQATQSEKQFRVKGISFFNIIY